MPYSVSWNFGKMVIMQLAMFPEPGMLFKSRVADINAARDLTLDAAQAARASGTSKRAISTSQIKKLLDSRNEREVLEGLRKITSVSLTYAIGQPTGWRPNSRTRTCYLEQIDYDRMGTDAS